MKKLNNKGFGITGILLVVLVLVAIGGVGWYVMRQRDKQTPKAEQSATSQQQADLDTLDIPELGIKVPLAGVTHRDLRYTMKSVEGEKGTYTVASISSQALSKQLEDAYKAETGEDTTNKPAGPIVLALIPSANFTTDVNGDLRADYPQEGDNLLSADRCVATIGDKKLCVVRTFIDYGSDYDQFVDSMMTAAAKASRL